jgi:hypothetical protein
MTNFSDLKIAVHKQFEQMSSNALFRTDTDKDKLWEVYLSSFPEGTNPIFRERTEHDCQCCKQFVRACGNAVAITETGLVSIWDIAIGGHYQPVVDALSKYVKSCAIVNVFLHTEKKVGTDYNHQILEDESLVKWKHFYYELPSVFVKRGDDIGTVLSERRSTKDVFKRGLIEITSDAIETVLELIDQNSLYRGEEHGSIVKLLLNHKTVFDSLKNEEEKEHYCWLASISLGGAARMKNSVIGTLLIDLSEGKELDYAVKAFEAKVAPVNYKRPTALITKGMIDKAQEKVEELGIGDSLKRRYAKADDITINNVLYADRSVKKAMNIFDELAEGVPDKVGNLSKVDSVDIETFINTILPKADSIELLFENKHNSSLMSLISPEILDSKRIFKWDNNFSWSYNGEVADSVKARVKKAGGNVTGVLRFTIQWNDGDDNQNDFDAHCIEPNGNLISYQKKGQVQPSSGILDVDIISPGKEVAVENIIHTDIDKMLRGEYLYLVHNYEHNGGRAGFTAEIEYGGQIYSFEYNKSLKQDEKVVVAKISFSEETGIKFITSLPSTKTSKEVWNIATEKYQKVSMVMHSPNQWDGHKTGNKHWFFILDGCKNDKPSRGFYNEFLSNDLTEHRKVFEVLGSKMKTDKSDNQLSGLGFSSTQRNHVYCRVVGSFSRTIKINF